MTRRVLAGALVSAVLAAGCGSAHTAKSGARHPSQETIHIFLPPGGKGGFTPIFHGNKPFLQRFGGLEQTGIYSVGFNLGSVVSILVSAVAVITYLIVIVNRLILAGWREGLATLWDRDILAFFLVGMLLFGLGLVGEYVGRIYQQVRERPRFMIRAVLEQTDASRKSASGETPPL